MRASIIKFKRFISHNQTQNLGGGGKDLLWHAHAYMFTNKSLIDKL